MCRFAGKVRLFQRTSGKNSAGVVVVPEPPEVVGKAAALIGLRETANSTDLLEHGRLVRHMNPKLRCGWMCVIPDARGGPEDAR